MRRRCQKLKAGLPLRKKAVRERRVELATAKEVAEGQYVKKLKACVAAAKKMIEHVVERIQKSSLFVGLFILPSFRWSLPRMQAYPVEPSSLAVNVM